MKRSVLIQNNPHKVESDSALLKTKDQSIVARNHRSFRSNHFNKRDKNTNFIYKKKYFISILFLIATLIFLGYQKTRIDDIILPDGYFLSSFPTLAKSKGKNIFIISPNKLAHDIKNSQNGIKNIEVQKIYPNSLVVSFENVRSGFILETNSQALVLGESGEITWKGSVVNLPNEMKENYIHILTDESLGLQNYKTGNKILSKLILKSIQIAKFFEKSQIRISSYQISSNGTATLVANSKTYIFDLNREITSPLLRLKIILENEQETEKYTKIDLRMEKILLN